MCHYWPRRVYVAEEVTMTHRGIRLGERFDLEIGRAIRHSGAVVWVVSSESVQNNYTLRGQ